MGERDRERIAREALLEQTPDSTVGAFLGETVEDDGVHTLAFAANLSGYPGWHWSVSLVELDGLDPTVLESELLPGEGALLAPDWVPWSQRLEEYRAAQAAAGESDESGLDDEGADDGDADDEFDEDADEDADPDADELIADIDDVIDYADDEASALLAMGEDEEDEAETESDEDGPEPADQPRLDDR